MFFNIYIYNVIYIYIYVYIYIYFWMAIPYLGSATMEALLRVKLRSLRGLPAEKAGGVVMVIRVGEQTFRSQGAWCVFAYSL